MVRVSALLEIPKITSIVQYDVDLVNHLEKNNHTEKDPHVITTYYISKMFYK